MKYNKEELEQAVKESKSISDVCRFFGIKPVGGNYHTIKNKIKLFGIDDSHFLGQAWNKGKKYKLYHKSRSLEDILVNDSYYQSNKLKQRLIDSGIKENKCECCGLTEWLGLPIKLELHHVNADKFDNRLENLQVLCPNCHSYTEHYRGTNKIRYDDISKKAKFELIDAEQKPKKVKAEKVKKYCQICGKELTNKQTKYCSTDCLNKSQTKRPEYDELLSVLQSNDFNLTKTSKIYNVTANAVKKWCKIYNITNGSNDFFHRKH